MKPNRFGDLEEAEKILKEVSEHYKKSIFQK